ncbi:MAG: gamma-glutamylcyclotransferase, partial [Rhodobacterales bacterium]
MTRTLALTPAHIARVHREVPDTGPPPGMEMQTDADYAA